MVEYHVNVAFDQTGTSPSACVAQREKQVVGGILNVHKPLGETSHIDDVIHPL